MQIRSETISDYAAIADINIQAFKESRVAAIVALMRQRPSFRPEFSLVAEENGKLLGHILFTEGQMFYAGAMRRIVTLSPLAVLPSVHNQGIGGALVREGHRLAQAEGFDAAVVLGHPTYYPRFGYENRAFGSSVLVAKDLPENTLEYREPIASDIPALMALWEQEEGVIDFAIRPDAHLADWLSPNPSMQAIAYLQNGELVGYSRGKTGDIRAFMAKNVDAARMMAKHLAGENAEITLPLHPASGSAKAFQEQPTAQAWDAGMFCIFNPSLAKSSVVGRPIWPSAFDLG
jgi:putative acetyltransferase